MKKLKRGSAGGRAVVAKRGKGHMSLIGRRGAAVLWARYKIIPVGTSGYSLVHRVTGAVVAVW